MWLYQIITKLYTLKWQILYNANYLNIFHKTVRYYFFSSINLQTLSILHEEISIGIHVRWKKMNRRNQNFLEFWNISITKHSSPHPKIPDIITEVEVLRSLISKTRHISVVWGKAKQFILCLFLQAIPPIRSAPRTFQNYAPPPPPLWLSLHLSQLTQAKNLVAVLDSSFFLPDTP